MIRTKFQQEQYERSCDFFNDFDNSEKKYEKERNLAKMTSKENKNKLKCFN